MLRDVEAVVGAEDDVRVVQDAGIVQLLHERLNHLINGLESPQPGPLELIVVLDNRGVEGGKVLDPADTAFNLGIEAGVSWDRVVLEKVGMARRILSKVKVRRVCCRVRGRRRVRCNGSSNDEPGAFVGKSLIQEAKNLVFDDVRRVVSGIADRLFSVPGHDCVVVLVSVRIEQEVGTVESLGKGLVVVGDGVAVPKLAGVVGVVTSVLHPDRQVVVVPALGNDLLEAAFGVVRIQLQWSWAARSYRKAERRP